MRRRDLKIQLIDSIRVLPSAKEAVVASRIHHTVISSLRKKGYEGVRVRDLRGMRERVKPLGSTSEHRWLDATRDCGESGPWVGSGGLKNPVV
jgi:hypothetical protein